jgi:hypothetical protein
MQRWYDARNAKPKGAGAVRLRRLVARAIDPKDAPRWRKRLRSIDAPRLGGIRPAARSA